MNKTMFLRKWLKNTFSKPSYDSEFQGLKNCAEPLNPSTNTPDGFTPYKILHDVCNNIPAFYANFPKDWQVEAHILTRYADVYNPTRLLLKGSSPTGLETFEFFPLDVNCWIEPNLFNWGGEQQWGATLEPPCPLDKILLQQVRKKYRKDVNNLQVRQQHQKPLTQQQKQKHPPKSGRSYACSTLLVEYSLPDNPQVFEDELEGIVYYEEARAPQGVQYLWGITWMRSIRAPRGRLQALRQMFNTIESSIRINPAWEQINHQYAQQGVAQLDRHQQNARMFLEQMAQTNRIIQQRSKLFEERVNIMNELSDSGINTVNHIYASNTAATDHVGNLISDSIRGQERFQDPYRGETSLEAGYEYNWTDGQGNWVQSNDAGYNPNTDPNLNHQTWDLGKRSES